MNAKDIALMMWTTPINAILDGLSYGLTIPGTDDFKIPLGLVLLFFVMIGGAVWRIRYLVNHR
jgi:hypothetical protein